MPIHTDRIYDPINLLLTPIRILSSGTDLLDYVLGRVGSSLSL